MAERLGGRRDALAIRANADIEFGLYVDPHPVGSDQRVAILALDRQPDGIHVHRGRLMQYGQYERAAVDDDLLAPEPGADEADHMMCLAKDVMHPHLRRRAAPLRTDGDGPPLAEE